MQSAAQPRQPTTVVENVAPPAPMPYGTTFPYLPPGATPTQLNGMDYYYSNGTYFRPVFNGSQAGICGLTGVIERLYLGL